MHAPLSPEAILQLGFSFWGSKTLLSAVEMGLFTELADGAMDARRLADRLSLHPRALHDFLDALVALGLLHRGDDGSYANTPEGDLFLDRRKPSYVGGILEMANTRLYPSWGNLTEALRTGKPQNEAAGGEDFFAELYADPRRLREFLQAMTGLSLGAGAAIAQKFPWKDYKTFTDVGSAQGGVAVQIALAHPHLTGAGWDLPMTGPIFEDYVASFGLADRLRFVPGDFFRDPIPPTDAIVMGHILHDWDLDEKRAIIRNAFNALREGGALIVFEGLIDDARREHAFGLLMSLNMLIETPGGFDYTGADGARWLREAGFRETRVEHLLGPDSMLVGIK